MTLSSFLWVYVTVAVLLAPAAASNTKAEATLADSDHDGLSDAAEQRLLSQFLPRFLVSRNDCSVLPARFLSGASVPEVVADDGTIYAQAFPRRGNRGMVELHYYHLWRKDCGQLGHPLDTEHVSALIAWDKDASRQPIALYWYAAAHEDTLCDASQMARAHTLSAEDHGATVWISPGKHASFFSGALCSRGCGGDRCEHMEPLSVSQWINLGEVAAPMDGSAWVAATAWPLQEKMGRSDFSAARIQRLDTLPATDVMWANPAKRPAQSAILSFNSGLSGALSGVRSTDTALVVANGDTDAALGESSHKTTRALSTSGSSVLKALKKSVTRTIDFLCRKSSLRCTVP